MFGDDLGCLLCAPKIASKDSIKLMFRQPVHHFHRLLTSPLVDFRIAMTAEPAGHIGLQVAN